MAAKRGGNMRSEGFGATGPDDEGDEMEQELVVEDDPRQAWVFRVAVAVIFVAFLLLLGRPWEDDTAPVAAPVASVEPAEPDVLVYEVGGTARFANVTYATPSGTSQTFIEVPMRNTAGDLGVTFRGRGIPHFAYVSAQNDGETGTIACKITLNGVTIAENTSSGAYAVVSCSA